jgi:hypothetical protein
MFMIVVYSEFNVNYKLGIFSFLVQVIEIIYLKPSQTVYLVNASIAACLQFNYFYNQLLILSIFFISFICNEIRNRNGLYPNLR